MTSLDPHAVASEWLNAFRSAVASADVDAFVNLFLPSGWLRDHLSFQWDLKSLRGHDNLKAYLSEQVDDRTRLARAGIHDVRLQMSSTLGPPIAFPIPSEPAEKGVQSAFEFGLIAPPALGRGLFRLVQDFNGNWKALAVSLILEDIKGHEESRDRPLGLFPDLSTYEEVKAKQLAAIDQDPTVLIIGAEQTGMMCAVRLRQLGVRALIIDKNPTVGHVWRNRYPNLTTQTTAHHCSMLYQPWPTTYPKYIGKDKVADFLEFYAKAQDLRIWLSSTTEDPPVYDQEKRRWKATVNRDGQKVYIEPSHIILAAGSGPANMPKVEGMSDFAGSVYHSDEHRGAAPFTGKRVLVVGSGNAAHDLCIDFVAKGASSVTMVQRGSTCVASANAVDKHVFGITFNEKYAIEDADFLSNSMPPGLGLEMAITSGTARFKAMDKDLFDGLTKAGLKLTWELTPGGGEVGFQGYTIALTTAGTMLDRGCGELIIDGKVKVKNGEIVRFEKGGVVFDDGRKADADVVVYATGYLSVLENIKSIFGESILDRIGAQIEGVDDGGEMRKAYRSTGQPGFWIGMGPFAHGRFFSKRLALQILADELGLSSVGHGKLQGTK
ncbi:FAD/NAD(P)-binding domain-containing protein [Daedalea quercina L-15889]|uniref:FAD/NAD(P)-binding domain-containing protein n=1 Tax=Daedalea quercina L-15889 TaxID=1314783 RepID=A0A165Q3X5_9APHY|nr:FAD/NAD(P)-binding domain-containing protein [Daedalea quercina L-15889]